MIHIVEVKVEIALTGTHGATRVLPSGSTLKVQYGGDHIWHIASLPGHLNYQITSADLHKHTRHSFDLIDECCMCEGSGKRVNDLNRTVTCRHCKGKGRLGRTYKANA